MHNAYHITMIGLASLFSLLAFVPRTSAMFLPAYDRWSRERLPNTQEVNNFGQGPQQDSNWEQDSGMSDNILLEYIASPQKQCNGEYCMVNQRVRLTICGTEVSEKCGPVTWDDFMCTSVVTASNGEYIKQRCRITTDLVEGTRNLQQRSMAKDVFAKKWDDSDSKIVPF